MSWYLGRMEASAMGHQMFSHTGEGGTYYDRQNAEGMKAAGEYQRLHLNKWLLEQWEMTEA